MVNLSVLTPNHELFYMLASHVQYKHTVFNIYTMCVLCCIYLYIYIYVCR